MSENTPDTPSDISTAKSTNFILLVLLGLAALAAVYFYFQSHNAAPQAVEENVELKKKMANMEELLTELRDAQLYREEERNVHTAGLQRTHDQAEQARAAIDTLQQEMTTWKTATNDLLTTEKGKPVAADRSALEKFHALYASERPLDTLPAKLRRDLDTVLPSIRRALETKDTTYAPGEGALRMIADTLKQAREATATFRDHNQQLAAITANLATTPPKNTPLLADALHQLQQQWAAERNRLKTELLEKTRREIDQQMAQAQADAKKRLADAEKKALLEYAEMGEQEIQDALQDARKKFEQEKLKLVEEQKHRQHAQRYQAAKADIDRYLACFFKPGFAQPKKNYADMTATKGPVSLSRLRTATYLDDNVAGLFQLSYFANRTSDRKPSSIPLISSPPTAKQTAALEQVIRAQELLREFGDDLVRDGLLAK